MLLIMPWLRREEGQDLTEYALLLGLIILLVMAAIATLGQAVSHVLSIIASTLDSAL